jgi:hypothetical protein
VPGATLEVVLLWATPRPKAAARMERVVICMVDVVVCDEVPCAWKWIEKGDVLIEQVKQHDRASEGQ